MLQESKVEFIGSIVHWPQKEKTLEYESDWWSYFVGTGLSRKGHERHANLKAGENEWYNIKKGYRTPLSMVIAEVDLDPAQLLESNEMGKERHRWYLLQRVLNKRSDHDLNTRI